MELSIARLLRDSLAAARAAQLSYVTPGGPGYVRRRCGRGFIYLAGQRRLTRRSELSRIGALAIPPAWEDVWICASPDGHVQAVGRDARGRRQYRYHERWREIRDQAKYEDAVAFARALPLLRAKVARDLTLPGLPKEKVLAAVLAIMERTKIRVGNDRFARDNDSYGLSTLLDRHARIQGDTVELRFRGKGGAARRASLTDARLARIVSQCRDIPGQRLFQFRDDDGAAHGVTSTDVNAYIREAMAGPFTAKTVRTWSGTYHAALSLFEAEPSASSAGADRVIKAAIERVAAILGNTQAICRRCYVHPIVIDAYREGTLHHGLEEAFSIARARRSKWLAAEERAVLEFLAAREAGVTPAQRVTQPVAQPAAQRSLAA